MKKTAPAVKRAVSLTELLLSWKDVQTKQAIIDFIAAVIEESSSAICRQRCISPSPDWQLILITNIC
jgi:hypothetical protein